MGVFENIEDPYLPDGGYSSELHDNVLVNMHRAGIIPAIENAVDGITQELYGQSFEDYLSAQDRAREISNIISIVGDDETGTGNSGAFALLAIAVGPICPRIVLSKHDCGINRYVGNYAEGYFLTPVNAEASFEAVNRRNRGSGVPFTLDPVKLKYLSPVRKQSLLDSMDLESKLKHLCVIAEYADPDWVTYNAHQACLILALSVFDMTNAKLSPFLFETEGGCGGCPPYQSLESAYTGLFHYARGKAREGILGVMEEATRINQGALAPQDSTFLRNVHLATIKHDRWLEIESAYRTLLKTGNFSRAELDDLLRNISESGLPTEITELGTTIKLDSYIIGRNLAGLRRLGLIMTDLDVKMKLEANKRTRAIFGDKPMAQVISESEEQLQNYKSKSLIKLTALTNAADREVSYLQSRLRFFKEPWNDKIRSILFEYYFMRSAENLDFSSFFYSDYVRVYKTTEIAPVLDMHELSLQVDFTSLWEPGKPRPEEKFLNENPTDKQQNDRLIETFNEKTLIDMVADSSIDGLTSDDPRILQSAVEFLRALGEESEPIGFFILFSSDVSLGVEIRRIFTRRNTSGKPVYFLRIPIFLYREMCLASLNDRSNPYSRKPKFYNYLRNNNPEVDFTPELMNKIYSEIRNSPALIWVEYDYPNLERNLEVLEVKRDGYGKPLCLISRAGGFLRRSTIRLYAKNEEWSRVSLDHMSNWSDFSSRNKVSRRIPRHELSRSFSNLEIYRSQWLRGLDRPLPSHAN